MISLEILDSPQRIADRSFRILTETETAAALSFGSTYRELFKRWNELAGETAVSLPALFPADERLVSEDDPESNWGAAWKLFSEHFGSKEDRGRHPRDIESYRKLLDEYFGRDDELPRFGLIFLGLGSDGHTASLFPGKSPAPGSDDWNKKVLRTTSPLPPFGRLTLGPELIARAERLVLIVTGEEKADIFAAFLARLSAAPAEQQSGSELPPVPIIRRREELHLVTEIFTDEAAAARREKEENPSWLR
jgi:6-phosphogluconolactonase/glucosamine-6-phosphate isomerase/deaminase